MSIFCKFLVEMSDKLKKVFDAIQNGSYNLVENFLNSGVPVNTKNAKGQSLLYFACMRGNVEIVKLLLQKGANPNSKSNDGDFPLIEAVYFEDKPEILEILLSEGADPNMQDTYGDTALIVAADEGYKKFIELLIKAGGDPYIKNKEGNDAFQAAYLPGIRQFVQKTYDEYYKKIFKETERNFGLSIGQNTRLPSAVAKKIAEMRMKGLSSAVNAVDAYRTKVYNTMPGLEPIPGFEQSNEPTLTKSNGSSSQAVKPNSQMTLRNLFKSGKSVTFTKNKTKKGGKRKSRSQKTYKSKSKSKHTSRKHK